MLLIKNNQICAEPIIDVINNAPLGTHLPELVEQYILRHKMPMINYGEMAEAFYLSGLSNYHHPRLLHYLSGTGDYPNVALQTGFFAEHHNPHIWLKIGEIIVDLTICQFADKVVKIFPGLNFLLHCSYFISNNPRNYIYQLYREN